jgi:hypothetical protein
VRVCLRDKVEEAEIKIVGGGGVGEREFARDAKENGRVYIEKNAIEFERKAVGAGRGVVCVECGFHYMRERECFKEGGI